MNVVSKIERDVAAHSRFERISGKLALLGIVVGFGIGVTRGATTVFFSTSEAIATSLILVIACSALLGKVRSFATPTSVRYVCAFLFLISLVISKKLASAEVGPISQSQDDFRCFLFGIIPSTLVMIVALIVHWKLQMSPSHRVRVITSVIAASAGLIAQTLHCPFLDLPHLLIAHWVPVLMVFVSICGLDQWLSLTWLNFAPAETQH